MSECSVGWVVFLLLKTKRLAQSPYGPEVKNIHHSVHLLLRPVDEVGAVSDRAPAAPNECAALGRLRHRLEVRATAPLTFALGLAHRRGQRPGESRFFMV